jgi:hypothetical protein
VITEQSGGPIGDIELEYYVSGEKYPLTPHKRYRGVGLLVLVLTQRERNEV